MKHVSIKGLAATSTGERAARAGITLICDVRQGARPWTQVRLEDLSPGGFRIA